MWIYGKEKWKRLGQVCRVQVKQYQRLSDWCPEGPFILEKEFADDP